MTSPIYRYYKQSLDTIIDTCTNNNTCPTEIAEEHYITFLQLHRRQENKYMAFMAKHYFKPKYK